jgi:hypothetical protein
VKKMMQVEMKSMNESTAEARRERELLKRTTRTFAAKSRTLIRKLTFIAICGMSKLLRIA